MNFALIFFFIHVFTTSAHQRVVSLSPNITEIVYALESKNQLVGVIDPMGMPQDVSPAVIIGSYARPSIEKIISLKPDLVLIAEEGSSAIIQDLKRANLNYKSVPLKKISDFEIATQTIGRLLKSSNTNDLIKSWKATLNSISKTEHPKSIAIQVESDPVFLAGKDTFISEVLSLCGHTNVSQEISFYRASQEHLLKLSPQIVLLVIHNLNPVSQNKIELFWKKKNPNVKMVKAEPNDLSRLGPRFASAAKDLCQKLGGIE